MSWSNGKAAQALFVFRPVQSGFELAEPGAFKAVTTRSSPATPAA